MNSKPQKQDKEGYYTLRFRSTGLGKTMLEGEPADVSIVGDMLVMHIQSTTPTRWLIRAALSYKGLLKMIMMSLKNRPYSGLCCLVQGLLRTRNWRKNSKSLQNVRYETPPRTRTKGKSIVDSVVNLSRRDCEKDRNADKKGIETASRE